MSKMQVARMPHRKWRETKCRVRASETDQLFPVGHPTEATLYIIKWWVWYTEN